MTERERIAHLLRRFAWGASAWELDAYAALGYEKARSRLLDFDQVEDGFPISPWEACFEEGRDEVYLDVFRPAGFWALRMLMSQRPLEQKLTLFWHDHFAVGGEKVEFGPALFDYLEILRRHGGGRFPDLLKGVVRHPALLRYLDGDQNLKGEPNENLARELFELHTMGRGNYTENDVQEAARALTGWGIRYLVFERGAEAVQATARELMLKNRPMLAFAHSPELHDDGPKTILGKTGRFGGEELLDLVALRPETARRITGKLWRFFAMEALPEGVHRKLESAFLQSGGNIRTVLRAMTETTEFWSPECVRHQIKSPADFVVGTLRALNVHPVLLALRPAPKTPLTPLPKPLRDTAGLVWGTMTSQGLSLLFPPNVGGWNWGRAWITSANMGQRTQFAPLILGIGQGEQPIAGWIAKLIADRGVRNDAEAVDAILAIFDCSLTPEKRSLLVEAFVRAGGVATFRTAKGASESLVAVLRPLFGSPEYQFC